MSGDGKLEQACERTRKFGTEGQSYSRMHKIFEIIKKL